MEISNHKVAVCLFLFLLFHIQDASAQNFPDEIQAQFNSGDFVLTDSGDINSYASYFYYLDANGRERFLVRYEVGMDSVHDAFSGVIPLYGYVWLAGARTYTEDDLFFFALEEETVGMRMYLEQVNPIEFPIDNFHSENFAVDLTPLALLQSAGSFSWVIEDSYASGSMYSGGPEFCLGQECQIGGYINLIGLDFVETNPLVFQQLLNFHDTRTKLYDHYSSSPDFKGAPGFFNYQFFELGLGCGGGSGIVGDLNGDSLVNLLDVSPFVCVIESGEYVFEADVLADGQVNLLDVDAFVELLTD